MPSLKSPQSITLTLIRKLKYIFHCGRTTVITYSFDKIFKTLKHLFPIKASSNPRSKSYSSYKCNPKAESLSASLHSQRKKKVKKSAKKCMKKNMIRKIIDNKHYIHLESLVKNNVLNIITSQNMSLLPFKRQVQFDKALKENHRFRDKLNKLKESNLRIF